MIEVGAICHCSVQEVIEMIHAKKGFCLAAFVLAACSGRSVDLGGGGGASAGSVIGQGPTTTLADAEASPACQGGCATGEKCCIVTVDVQACTTATQCLGTSSCPPVPCEPAPPTGGADAGLVVGADDAGTSSVQCGNESCSAGQDCCIVTVDVQSCATGLQCVWGGCPPAPCDPHSGG